MKFLGWASNYTFREAIRHRFVRGRKSDRQALADYLDQTYGGKSYLYYNGRSALAVALKTLLGSKAVGAKIGVNAYTCYAVVQAIREVGAKVVYLDIDRKTYNFTAQTFAEMLKKQKLSAVIVQNTLGVVSDITGVEKLAKRTKCKIIEDLAHSVGLRYKDGRKVGTVGDAVFFSFGRGKPVDAEHGAALVLRGDFVTAKVYAPTKLASRRERHRDRIYPLRGWWIRKTYRFFALGKIIAWLSKKTGAVRGSAEGQIEPYITMTDWQARLVLEQLQNKPRLNRLPLLVANRKKVLKALARRGYYFDSIWWDTAVAPRRYFSQVSYNAKRTPIAYEVGEQMINLPTNLTAKQKREVIAIIKRAIQPKPVKGGRRG
ncbi:MAG: DegT/DnrJ/EryC1/StrS family aminotransferase [Candidatus Nomurabacteria bacterium]|jgi:dTDP-4-amino-4,6-dideoxygalactose transaminase|nr:DegT/DnrJ/EryC1/StrS family aminotransferase [Candidatus Nomurabacteria bacterium]